MTLKFLLDENVSPVVTEQVQRTRPEVVIESVLHWRGGEFLSQPDAALLAAAHAEGWTLVTYDTQILLELYFWFAEARPFSGLIFIDDKTIGSHEFGALVGSLLAFWDAHGEESWDGRLVYLSRAL